MGGMDRETDARMDGGGWIARTSSGGRRVVSCACPISPCRAYAHGQCRSYVIGLEPEEDGPQSERDSGLSRGAPGEAVPWLLGDTRKHVRVCALYLSEQTSPMQQRASNGFLALPGPLIPPATDPKPASGLVARFCRTRSLALTLCCFACPARFPAGALFQALPGPDRQLESPGQPLRPSASARPSACLSISNLISHAACSTPSFRFQVLSRHCKSSHRHRIHPSYRSH